MSVWAISALLIGSLVPLVALSSADAQNVSSDQQANAKLDGLSQADADALIEKLKDAQQKLTVGQKLYFELLSGAPASYEMAQIAPRQAFLKMSFDRPWSVERLPTTGLWQPYYLTYFPSGPTSLMWKVRLVTGYNGEIVRVEMLYTAPPPF